MTFLFENGNAHFLLPNSIKIFPQFQRCYMFILFLYNSFFFWEKCKIIMLYFYLNMSIQWVPWKEHKNFNNCYLHTFQLYFCVITSNFFNIYNRCTTFTFYIERIRTQLWICAQRLYLERQVPAVENSCTIFLMPWHLGIYKYTKM